MDATLETDKGTGVKVVEKTVSVWDSGLRTVREITIILPAKIIRISDAIKRKVAGNEFSFLMRAQWVGENIVIGEAIIIPKQEVSMASVDFLEDLTAHRRGGWNCILHSHPSGCSGFSSSDDETINSHFDVSLLFLDGKIVQAIYNVQVSDSVKIQMDCKVEVREVGNEDISVENIKERQQWTGTGVADDYSYEGGFSYGRFWKDMNDGKYDDRIPYGRAGRNEASLDDFSYNRKRNKKKHHKIQSY